MSSKPVELGTQPSFGFGDRLGVATPGHLQALIEFGGPIKGIFAQQSIREMTRTKRTPEEVMKDASLALDDLGFRDVCGADADHLKTKADVDATAKAGFTFFTIDPSDAVDQQADDYDAATLEQKFSAVQAEISWLSDYQGKTLQLPNGPTIEFSEECVMRAAVKYGAAIAQALELADYIKRVTSELGQAHEIELSVDETDQPTTLAEHYIIADQFRQAGVKLVCIAPRFIGDFEKGVDFKGDSVKLQMSLNDHAAIAKELGPYKLSLHSGSDKLSMYAALARATNGLFHVKTAGTSYLEAVRVAARHEPELFRTIVGFARDRYEIDKATYHVSATLDSAPPAEEVKSIEELEQLYLENWSEVPEGKGFTNPGRQILHCTFGSVLTDDQLGPALKQLLQQHPNTYTGLLTDHFGRHLRALCSGLE